MSTSPPPPAAGALRDAADQVVPDRVDGDEDADRHAALSGRAVSGVDGGVGCEVEVGVGEDHHVVLGAAERLDALAVLAGFLVDVPGDRGRADEADGLDVGALEERVHRGLVTVQDVEHAVGKSRFLPEVRDPERRCRVLLARLENDCVAGGDGDGEEPHGHHRRKVERADDADHSQRVPLGMDVDAGRRGLRVAALEELCDSAGVLHDLLTAGDLAERIGVHLAVLCGDDRGQLVLAVVEQLTEAEDHLGASSDRRTSPGLGGSRGRGDDRGGVVRARKSHSARDLARGGVGDVCPVVRSASELASVGPVGDVGGHLTP
jgi:hypothetical protein